MRSIWQELIRNVADPAVAPPADPAAPSAPAPAPAAVVPDPSAKPAGSADPPPADSAKPPADPAKPDPSLLAKPPEVKLFDPKEAKLPEGFTLSEADMKTFSEFAAGEKISHEAGQKLLEMHAGIVKATNDAAHNHYRATREGWVKEVKADKEIGGTNFEETRSNISKVIDQYGTKELRDVFDLTGAGDNPHVIRFLARVAKVLTEGTKSPTGGPPAQGAKRSGAQIMYPNMPSGE